VKAAWRVAARVAGTAQAAWQTAARLRRLGAGAEAEDRALCLRDGARRFLDLHGIEVRLSGPIPEGPALLASNHVSWLDPLVVAGLVPCVPISKMDVSGWPVIGAIVQELGVVFTQRDDRRSGVRVLRAARAAFGHGLPVLNFPEGTTTRGASVLPFRKGLFGVAREAGVPVVPVALAYDPVDLAWVGDDSFLPHYLRLAGGGRARARVRFGPALPAHADAAALARGTHAEVARLLESLR
jgi:1-acyl-sn-glycerol-3-phosphate acyltransferase